MRIPAFCCAAVLGLSFLAHPETGHAKGAKPVRLSVTVPFREGKNSIQNSSGWQLTIRLLAGKNLGIATGGTPGPLLTFPANGQTGWIVFDDPDGCLQLSPPFFTHPDCIRPIPPDETFLMFTPDVDQPGVEDDFGDAGRRDALTDSAGGGMPMFVGMSTIGPGGMVALGPDTGGDIIDGYGRGTDDDLPGLVVLSATGPGLVLDENFDRGSVLEQYNLAGFLNQVGYELTDTTRHTTVSGSLLVPYGLVAPFVKVDPCVGMIVDDERCDQAPIWRVDGGPIEPVDPAVTAPPFVEPINGGYPNLFEATDYEMRFFVVNGIAPSILTDMNGNGTITARDATLMGYHVISNEVRIRFNQFHGLACFRSTHTQIVLSDLDGNGTTAFETVCGAGPGGLTKPPR